MSSNPLDSRLDAMDVFRSTYQTLTDRWSELLERHHRISTSDFAVLSSCAAQPDQRLPITEVARLTRLTPSGTSRVVSRTERAGLVRREPGEQDRRSWYVVVTDEGMSTYQAAATRLITFSHEMIVGRLDSSALAEILTALRILIQASPQS